MGLGSVIACGHTHIYCWTVTETPEQLTMLCHEAGIDTSCVQGIKAARRCCELLAERLLLQQVAPTATLQHDTQGKPYLQGSDLHVSISHARGIVCLAINDQQPMGIDIEEQRERVLSVRHKFLSEAEMQLIDEHDLALNIVAWTAKEALYKLAGTPGEGLPAITLKSVNTGTDGTTTVSATINGEHYAAHSQQLGNYTLTVATPACK